MSKFWEAAGKLVVFSPTERRWHLRFGVQFLDTYTRNFYSEHIVIAPLLGLAEKWGHMACPANLCTHDMPYL